MNIILFDSRTGHSRTICLRSWLVACVAVGLLVMAGLAGAAAAMSGAPSLASDGEMTQVLRQDIAASAEQVGRIRQDAEDQMTAVTVRMAELQARLMRLDALGERLVGMAKLDGGEFDFSRAPGVGGPEKLLDTVSDERPHFLAALDQLAADIEQRESQLAVLESLLSSRSLSGEAHLDGRPVKTGWLSSAFGRRADPFTGRTSWHEGVDFAGKPGDSFVAAGAGVVTWAGERHGYGMTVEVNHGGGYITRYAHGKSLAVKVGDIVRKGEVLGTIGSSGRSTGPHLHFEVRLNGKAINPARYIARENTQG